MTTQTTISLADLLPFTPNEEQLNALDAIQQFLDDSCKERFFILKGAAGTGKTSIIKAVTEYLDQEERIFYLTAPTGRAAQIIGKKTEQTAVTTHSLVYSVESDLNGLVVRLKHKQNIEGRQALFIVDEASLVSNNDNGGDGSFISEEPLLKRLIDFANEGNTANKFLFIGDGFQLPPVGANYSPALSEEYLFNRYKLNGRIFELTQVMRQEDGSGILETANLLRSCILNGNEPGALNYISAGGYGGAIRKYASYFEPQNDSRAVFIGRSNKQVLAMNQAVRRQLFGWHVQELLLPGDHLVANQNCIINDQIIFSGTPMWVERCGKREEFAGTKYQNIILGFQSITGEQVSVRTKIVLDTLINENGQMGFEQRKAIIHEAIKLNRKYRESKRPEDDAFVGAIQARYGYALTCHKAQGGEWENVFLNPMFGQAESRWLYTAVTRASQQFYSW